MKSMSLFTTEAINMSHILLQNFPVMSLDSTSPKEMELDEIISKAADFLLAAPNWEWIRSCLSHIIPRIGTASISMEEGQVVTLMYGKGSAYVPPLQDLIASQRPDTMSEHLPIVVLLGYDLVTGKFCEKLVYPCRDGADLSKAFQLDSEVDTLRKRAHEGMTPFSPRNLTPNPDDDTVVYATIVRCQQYGHEAFAFNIFYYQDNNPYGSLKCYVGMFHFKHVSDLMSYLDGIVSVAKIQRDLKAPFEVPEGMSFTTYIDSLILDDVTFKDMLNHVEGSSNELVN